jgi:Domain of Unknown Function (DUF1206)
VPSAQTTAGRAGRRTEREALEVERSRPFDLLVRAGFATRALTYGVVGAIALALAVGAGPAPAAPNQQGALAFIAQAPLGRVAIAVAAAGLLAYSLWKLGQAAFGRGPEGGGGPKPTDRIASAAGGVVYLGFFAVAVRILFGSPSNSSSQPSTTAAGVLGWPGGPVLVGIAGAVLIAVSLYQAYDALRGKFAEDSKLAEMSQAVRRAFLVLGRVGLVARALVFVIVGYFVLKAAIDYNPRDAVGLDGALAHVHHEPFGPFLLAIVAAGLIVFAVYSLFEARYRRL